MLPLTAAFEAVAQMFSTNSFNEQEAKVSPPPMNQMASGQSLVKLGLGSCQKGTAYLQTIPWLAYESLCS